MKTYTITLLLLASVKVVFGHSAKSGKQEVYSMSFEFSARSAKTSKGMKSLKEPIRRFLDASSNSGKAGKSSGNSSSEKASHRFLDVSGNSDSGKASKSSGDPSSDKASHRFLDASGNSGSGKAGKSSGVPSSDKASRRFLDVSGCEDFIESMSLDLTILASVSGKSYKTRTNAKSSKKGRVTKRRQARVMKSR